MDEYAITDYDLQALIDNELDWEHEKLVLQYIESNAVAKHRYEQLLQQKSLLLKWAGSRSN